MRYQANQTRKQASPDEAIGLLRAWELNDQKSHELDKLVPPPESIQRKSAARALNPAEQCASVVAGWSSNPEAYWTLSAGAVSELRSIMNLTCQGNLKRQIQQLTVQAEALQLILMAVLAEAGHGSKSVRHEAFRTAIRLQSAYCKSVQTIAQLAPQPVQVSSLNIPMKSFVEAKNEQNKLNGFNPAPVIGLDRRATEKILNSNSQVEAVASLYRAEN